MKNKTVTLTLDDIFKLEDLLNLKEWRLEGSIGRSIERRGYVALEEEKVIKCFNDLEVVKDIKSKLAEVVDFENKTITLSPTESEIIEDVLKNREEIIILQIINTIKYPDVNLEENQIRKEKNINELNLVQNIKNKVTGD